MLHVTMTKRLFLQERREQILELLDRQGRVLVNDLSERFALSPATIRSDLESLALQGLLKRTHGGAIPIDRESQELSFTARNRIRVEQKRRIGAAAAALVADGEAIALDASTTALSVARQIKHYHKLTVVTNGLFAAQELLGTQGITTLMPGGFLRQDSASLVGADGSEFIQQFYFHKGFFGAKGFTVEEGLTEIDRQEVAVKQALIERTKQVIAIVDSGKWGQVSFTAFAPIERLHAIITDDAAPPDMIAQLEARGVQVILA